MSKYNTINNNKYLQKPDVIQKNMHTSSVPTKYIAQPIKTNIIQKNLHGLPVKNKYSNLQSDKFISKKSMYFQKANFGNVARGLKELERLKGLGHSVEDAWKQFVGFHAPTPDMVNDMMKESPDFSLAFNEPWEVPQSEHQKISDLYDSIIPMTHTNPELSQGMFAIQEARKQGKSKRRALYDFMQTQPTPSLIPDIVERVGLTPKATAKLTDVYDEKYGLKLDDDAMQGTMQGNGLQYQSENPSPRQLFPKTVGATGFIQNPRGTLNDVSIKDETYNTPLDVTNIKDPVLNVPMSDAQFWQHFQAHSKSEPTINDLMAIENTGLNGLMEDVYDMPYRGLEPGYDIPMLSTNFLGEYPYLPAVNERTGQQFINSNTGTFANSNVELDSAFRSQYHPSGHPLDNPDSVWYANVVKLLEGIPHLKEEFEMLRRNGRNAYNQSRLYEFAEKLRSKYGI